MHDDGGGDRRARALAAAQLPGSFQTLGNKGQANEAQICAADFEASIKPVAKYVKDAK